MENPYEHQQAVLLSRIVNSVSKLNSSVNELTERMKEINNDNVDIAKLSDMWAAYDSSVQIHLESTKSLSEPL
ncbi:DASH complex subunit Dad4 [Gongronella butleri]|nr:DASH complex subunit Dad4 [Gongronella butleri]